MWHSSWEGPCRKYDSAEMSWTSEEDLQRMRGSFLFSGQTGTAAQRPFVPTLFTCCRLVIVYLLCLFSFLPLSLWFFCFSTHCVTASSLWPIVYHLACLAPSAYHNFSLLPLSLKTGKLLTFHSDLCSLSFFFPHFCSWMWCTKQDSDSLNVYVQWWMLYQWVLHLCWVFNYASLLLMTNPSIPYPFCLCLFVSLCLQGNIKNTEPLDSKRQRVHTFWVTAFDCGKNRAQADTQVVVTVKPSCKPGWIGKHCHRLLCFCPDYRHCITLTWL